MQTSSDVPSEKLAFEACADLTNELLGEYKIKINPPYNGESLLHEFVGQNFRGMMLVSTRLDFTSPTVGV